MLKLLQQRSTIDEIFKFFFFIPFFLYLLQRYACEEIANYYSER